MSFYFGLVGFTVQDGLLNNNCLPNYSQAACDPFVRTQADLTKDINLYDVMSWHEHDQPQYNADYVKFIDEKYKKGIR